MRRDDLRSRVPGRADLMQSDDLRGVADGERLLALVELRLQLLGTRVQREGLQGSGGRESDREETRPTSSAVPSGWSR